MSRIDRLYNMSTRVDKVVKTWPGHSSKPRLPRIPSKETVVETEELYSSPPRGLPKPPRFPGAPKKSSKKSICNLCSNNLTNGNCLDCKLKCDMCGRMNLKRISMFTQNQCRKCFITELKTKKLIKKFSFDLPPVMQCVLCHVSWERKNLSKFGVCPDCVNNVSMEGSKTEVEVGQMGSKRRKTDLDEFKEVSHLHSGCKDCPNLELIQALTRENAELKSSLLSLELGTLKM